MDTDKPQRFLLMPVLRKNAVRFAAAALGRLGTERCGTMGAIFAEHRCHRTRGGPNSRSATQKSNVSFLPLSVPARTWPFVSTS